MTNRKRAMGYVRVSTEEQSREGVSMDNQEEKIKHYAEIEGFELVKVIREEGKSGKDLNREGIQEVIETCKAQDIDHIVVYKLDRITRRTIDLLYLMESVFAKNNVEFHSITEKIDTTTAQGKFFLTLMGAMAQMERDLVSERTKDALRYKKERGENVGSPALGFVAKNKELVRNDRELEIIKTIRQYTYQTLQEIADILNVQGIKGKRGGKFYPSTIAYIRNNEIYETI